jgi:ligand-binding SRPBCC domain-containing protein
MGIYRIHEKQLIAATIEDGWDFISNPENLSKITPDNMGFKITTLDLPEKMYPGMMISYRVKPLLGIPVTWVTEITHVQEQQYFVDEQRVGPYALWHHEHFIESTKDGLMMTDIVTYKLPLGFLGRIAHALFVRKQLRRIFEYRRAVLEKRF